MRGLSIPHKTATRKATTHKATIRKVDRVSASRRSNFVTKEDRVATQNGIRPRSQRTPEQLGARIRKARAELGLSLAAVAQNDFSRAFLNQIELGHARPAWRRGTSA